MPTEAPTVQRVVVGLDSTSADADLLQVAAALALALRAELAGLYIEDEQLLRLAELPIARELGFPSARPRRLAPHDVQRALRVQADRARQLMAGLAEQLELSWTLEVVRGEMSRSALTFTTITDLLIVGGSQYRSLMMEKRRAPIAGYESLAARPVAVLFDGSGAALRALLVARLLAGESGSRLLVLIPAQDREAFQSLREEAANALEQQSADYMFIPGGDFDTLKRALQGQHAAAIFWPRREGDEALELLASRTRLNCPLVLIG